jgi:2-polyprenyl-6-methoxyphenol hydroxylase-like FAD-dependent oxidoreductase
MNGRLENYIRPNRGWAAFPTNDDLTLVVAGWPFADLADRIRSATREARVVGEAVPNYLRKPFGHGWALVGEAAYNKDLITAQGIADAFRDAELCATALDETFSGSRSFDPAMADYQESRRACPAHVIVHCPARVAGTAATEPPATAWRYPRQSGSDGLTGAGELGSDVTGRVLLRGERRTGLRRRPLTG